MAVLWDHHVDLHDHQALGLGVGNRHALSLQHDQLAWLSD